MRRMLSPTSSTTARVIIARRRSSGLTRGGAPLRHPIARSTPRRFLRGPRVKSVSACRVSMRFGIASSAEGRARRSKKSRLSMKRGRSTSKLASSLRQMHPQFLSGRNRPLLELPRDRETSRGAVRMFFDAFSAEDRERSQERGRERGETSGASQSFFDGANGLRSEVAGKLLLRDGWEQSEQAKQLEGEGENGISLSFPAALQEVQGEIEDCGERFLVVEESEEELAPLFRHGELFDGECGRVIQALCRGDGPSGTALRECKGEVLVSQKVAAHAA